jgi:hypothetical protein
MRGVSFSKQSSSNLGRHAAAFLLGVVLVITKMTVVDCPAVEGVDLVANYRDSTLVAAVVVGTHVEIKRIIGSVNIAIRSLVGCHGQTGHCREQWIVLVGISVSVVMITGLEVWAQLVLHSISSRRDMARNGLHIHFDAHCVFATASGC